MDPTIIGAFISAGASLVSTLFEAWSDAKSQDKQQPKIDAWVGDHYDEINSAITEQSIRLLLAAEYGKKYRIDEFRQVLHPKLKLDPDVLDLFDKEFHYRLEFLVLHGVLTKGMRDYRISRLGAAFLAQARKRRDYASALG